MQDHCIIAQISVLQSPCWAKFFLLLSFWVRETKKKKNGTGAKTKERTKRTKKNCCKSLKCFCLVWVVNSNFRTFEWKNCVNQKKWQRKIDSRILKFHQRKKKIKDLQLFMLLAEWNIFFLSFISWKIRRVLKKN